MPGPTVSGALRRFLPAFLAGRPPLAPARSRAVAAILGCRTEAMGGHVHACPDCGATRFAWHSCNHKACPLCGRDATARWVEGGLRRLAGAPHFLVTFTLPAELRGLFHGPDQKQAIDLLFAAASGALADKLADQRWAGLASSGFTAVLHTWNQRLGFHPHLHLIVPGAGPGRDGRVRRVKNANFLVPVPVLREAFRARFLEGMGKLGWGIDPGVRAKDWCVHVQPAGDGAAAVKYLGAYVARGPMGDSRLVSVSHDTVTFRFKDRPNGGGWRNTTVTGVDFVGRWLLHVLPRGTRSIRYYGLHHASRRAELERVRFHTGRTIVIGPPPGTERPPRPPLACPCCGLPMLRVGPVAPGGTFPARAPP